MDCASAVGAVSTEIELAVAVNLLVGLWGRIYETQQDMREQLVRRVEEIASGDRLRGEVDMSPLNAVSRASSAVSGRLWRVGSGAGIVSAAVPYLGVWLLYWLDLPLPAEQPLWKVALAILAFASPALLLCMVSVGRTCNSIVKELGVRIETLDVRIRRKRESAERRMAEVHRILTPALSGTASQGAIRQLADSIVR